VVDPVCLFIIKVEGLIIHKTMDGQQLQLEEVLLKLEKLIWPEKVQLYTKK
jgi:hypothetical protein